MPKPVIQVGILNFFIFMKKNFVKFFVVFLFCAVSGMGVQAQNTFSKGDMVAGVGIGVSNLGFPMLSGTFEYCIKDNLFNDKSSLGIGGLFGFATKKTGLGNGYGWKYNHILLGARGALHYQLVDNLDTYAGLMMGYDIGTVKWYGDTAFNLGKSSAGGFLAAFHAGARYYFANNFGASAEFGGGYGIAYLQLGVAFKF